MAVAANIDEAIAFAASNIISNGVGALTAKFATWIVIFGPNLPGPGLPFDQQSMDQRSVRDWFGPNLLIQAQIDETTTGMAILSASAVIDIVSRTLFAVKFAAINSRITANQRDSVVAQYNAAWA